MQRFLYASRELFLGIYSRVLLAVLHYARVRDVALRARAPAAFVHGVEPCCRCHPLPLEVYTRSVKSGATFPKGFFFVSFLRVAKYFEPILSYCVEATPTESLLPDYFTISKFSLSLLPRKTCRAGVRCLMMMSMRKMTLFSPP